MGEDFGSNHNNYLSKFGCMKDLIQVLMGGVG